MRKVMAVALGGVAMLAMAGPAQAQDTGKRYGYTAIERSDLAGAEARLIAQRAAEPNEPAVLINLAHVYGKTGRPDEAAALYQEILRNENVLMALGNGEPAWSHDLARTALNRSASFAAKR
jgi:pentatricopeptide repeat protein